MRPASAASTNVITQALNGPYGLWIKLGAAVLALVLAVIIVRRVLQMNKLILGVIVFLVLTFVGFSWIYERNEPSWATPVVEKLSGFFPTKDSMKH